ncbi:MAG: histidine kinase, partial [Marinilabiliales bacterium]
MAENETTKFEISIAIKALFWGLLFSIISIGFLFAREDLELSLGAFSKLHTLQPIVFFLEFIPLIFYLVVLTYSRKNAKLRKNQERQIENLKNSIESNAEFAKKIGKGDYSVRVDDIDEKDLLGKSLLVMRDNLLETSHKEREQDWISKGKDIISDVLRQHNDIDSLAYDVIVHILKYTDIIQGSFYLYDEDQDLIVNKATHAYNRKKYINQEFKVGHGLIGQAAFEMDMIYRTEIPDYYVTITSGLIKDKKPGSILIMPLISEEKLHGVIEMASVDDTIPELSRRFIREISVIIAQTVFNLKVNIRTEKLLSDAQELTRELKENEEQLRENAEEMRITHEELEKSNQQLEEKITEVQNAQKRLHSLLENASEVISIYDKDMSVMYESPSVKKILGYEAQEVIGNKGFNTFDEKGQALYEETFKKLLANPYEPQTVEVSYRKTDGTEIYLESLGRNLVDNPAIGGIIFNTRDVTQRKIAEKEQRMRGQMQALSENSP